MENPSATAYKDMLRDRMELPLVEKYTHLSMPRIQELARGLGML